MHIIEYYSFTEDWGTFEKTVQGSGFMTDAGQRESAVLGFWITVLQKTERGIENDYV